MEYWNNGMMGSGKLEDWFNDTGHVRKPNKN